MPVLLHVNPSRYDTRSSSFIFLDSYEFTLTPVIIAVSFLTMSSVSILRWYFEFCFDQIDVPRYIDEFDFSEEWPFIQIIRGNRTIKLGYMNKSPQITGKITDVSIFHKYTIYRIDSATCTGTVVSTTEPQLPRLPLQITKQIPYTTKFEFSFDYHVMMTIMAQMDDVQILEHKEIALLKATVIYCSVKIDVVQGILSYTGIEHNEQFLELCSHLQAKYAEESPPLLRLFSQLGDYPVKKAGDTTDPLGGIDPGATHLALSYDVWYRASRENQREWPDISSEQINDRSIEFPHDSGIWYTPPPDRYIGLSLRHDDNVHLYIPRIYQRDHRLHDSYLRDYIEGTQNVRPPKIPVAVNKAAKLYGTYFRSHYNYTNTHDALFLEYTGDVIMTYRNPKHIVYRDYVIGCVTRDTHALMNDGDVQLLDRNWRRCKVLQNGTWIDDHGPRIMDIPALPYYYRQIVHDYYKLGRLRDGPYMDLMHIGIVDPDGSDVITFPVPDMANLYVAATLETHRLLTFKFRPHLYEEYN